MKRREIVGAGVMVVLLLSAYVVPYTLLSGVDAWYGSFLFWVIFGLLAIAWMWGMTSSWRD